MKSIRLMAIMLALACSVVMTPTRSYRASADENIKRVYKLSNTGYHSHAKGTIKVVSTVDDGDIEKQRLNIDIKDLAHHAAYIVFIDGVEAASFETDGDGDAKIDTSTKFKGHGNSFRDVSFPSRSGIVEVRALDGTVVLSNFRR